MNTRIFFDPSSGSFLERTTKPGKQSKRPGSVPAKSTRHPRSWQYNSSSSKNFNRPHSSSATNIRLRSLGSPGKPPSERNGRFNSPCNSTSSLLDFQSSIRQAETSASELCGIDAGSSEDDIGCWIEPILHRRFKLTPESVYSHLAASIESTEPNDTAIAYVKPAFCEHSSITKEVVTTLELNDAQPGHKSFNVACLLNLSTQNLKCAEDECMKLGLPTVLLENYSIRVVVPGITPCRNCMEPRVDLFESQACTSVSHDALLSGLLSQQVMNLLLFCRTNSQRRESPIATVLCTGDSHCVGVERKHLGVIKKECKNAGCTMHQSRVQARRSKLRRLSNVARAFSNS